LSIVEQALKKFQQAREAPGSRHFRDTPALGVIREVPEQEQAASTGLPPPPRRVVHLDLAAMLAAGFLPPDSQRRRIDGQFRHIKRPLLDSARGDGTDPGHRGRLIMVGSSMPGEGKTFTSVNLAISMAQERDTTVLLVDADVAKPHITRMFGLEGEPGLLEALQDGDVDPEGLVLPTDIPGLSLLPAGRPVDNATELLASERMRACVRRLDEARGSSRLVLFDSPPLLLTNESRVLARLVNQIVLVVRAGETPQQAVFDAIDCLGEQKSVGLVLNQSEMSESSGYYYRHGTYGSYGVYGDSAE
jgi:protein-tyrosine kinase